MEASAVADRIIEGFLAYREAFSDITRGACERFVSAEWQQVQDAAKQRIGLYREIRGQVAAILRPEQPDAEDWQRIRSAFQEKMVDQPSSDFVGTFFNSVFRATSPDIPLDDRVAFVTTDPLVDAVTEKLSLQTHEGNRIDEIFRAGLMASACAPHLANIDTDIERIRDRLAQSIPLLRESQALRLELVPAPFCRNKGAYLVGRLFIGEHTFPVAIALCHSDTGVEVDAVLWGESRLSVIFSFTRAYFMVDLEQPAALVDYLQTLLPGKKRWELSTALGYYKHGKTEFVRSYRQHLHESNDRFVIAEGIKGQVMMVFVLASYQIVFKVMKDRFPATKKVDHDDVRAAYKLVKTHDRVGRMADTQEFQNFDFPLDRFDPALLEELLEVCADSVRVIDDRIHIKHLYTERLMTPLNLYLQRCSKFQATQVIDDYGRAIKELAAANIFPGDMLLKNFGVTRHGRVVFYDYDEICYLTEVVFRNMPKQESGQSQSSEPWFEVGEYDVFPEEFSIFLFPDEKLKSAFVSEHGEMFTAEGWKAIQEKVRLEQMMDVYPYPARERLADI